MVENNKNDETPRKRTRLFGGRRKTAEQSAPATEPSAPAVDQTPVEPTPVEPTPVEATAVESAPEPVDTVAEPEAAPAATAARRRSRATTPAARAAKATAAAEVADADAGDTDVSNTVQTDAAATSTAESFDQPVALVATSTTSLLFHAPPPIVEAPSRAPQVDDEDDEPSSSRSRRRRRSGDEPRDGDDQPGTVVRVRQPRKQPEPITEPQKIKGSTRLEAKKQRRRDGRDAGRRRPVITEAEFLARRESVDRVMVVRSKFGRIQIGVLEDGVLVEHYVAKAQDASLIGNVYLGRVQNVLPSMEAAFVDIGRGRNAVLYSGEVDWDAAAAEADNKNQARRIELALKPGDKVLVQVTKDPIGHKGARLTSQVSLPGRYLVYVPNGSMSGISRKLPDTERTRLKKILKEVLPDGVGVIVRTAAEGATEEQLTLDVNRLTAQWAEISRQVETVNGPAMLHSEPDLLVKIVRDVFNEDFHKLVIEGDDASQTIEGYLRAVAPDLLERVEKHTSERDSFDEYRISEQIEKALDRKVWLPSGGSLVIDRTEAMTVVDVNTGKFVGSGGNLEETVTKNNLEAAEEIVRQLRLRDIGGIIVVDFIDMVLETNRDLVLRRLVECLSRDRTKHQVAEVTSLGLVQMTRKKLGLGLIESFSEPCDTCAGRGIIIHHDPVLKHRAPQQQESSGRGRRGKGNGGNGGGNQQAAQQQAPAVGNGTHAITEDVRHALAQIAASTVQHPTEAAESATSGKQTQLEAIAETARHDAKSDSEKVAAAEATVAILDIPVKKASRPSRKISTADAEQILGSVLESLPEPKQPGQGRTRTSRRASSSGGAPGSIG
ncbi:Rne/Rng family ribonuclease [Salinibacterium sp. ZJ454]|uniref:Rne/Rng family ribonuclease n=1 Tax=Salinibacterium sp. ZJ454 TaxID=2708339 RepID=UPI001421DFB8|nr:Rne/Rng family ribonuclease [Salinibacterium sp. ZJ454]